MSEEKKKETSKTKKKFTLGKAQVAMLSVGATVLVFIMTFSCYGCSYQPHTPPTEEEAKVVLDNLYNSTWELDTAMGVTSLPEMRDTPVEGFEILDKNDSSGSANALMYLQGRPMIRILLAYQEDVGFTIHMNDRPLPITLVYAISKDGKSETLTMIGNESNTHCYYLKK